eukprot:s1600_g1.t1
MFPTTGEIGRRGTPPVSHISDYWDPWDEVLDSLTEYHLFVADVAVMEHISEIATASGNCLQLCPDLCFWEDYQAHAENFYSLHWVPIMQGCEMICLISEISPYKPQTCLDVMELPMDLMDIEINNASWIPPEASLVVVLWHQSSTTFWGYTTAAVRERDAPVWLYSMNFAMGVFRVLFNDSFLCLRLEENNFKSCTMRCRAGGSGILTDHMTDGE